MTPTRHLTTLLSALVLLATVLLVPTTPAAAGSPYDTMTCEQKVESWENWYDNEFPGTIQRMTARFDAQEARLQDRLDRREDRIRRMQARIDRMQARIDLLRWKGL